MERAERRARLAIAAAVADLAVAAEHVRHHVGSDRLWMQEQEVVAAEPVAAVAGLAKQGLRLDRIRRHALAAIDHHAELGAGAHLAALAALLEQLDRARRLRGHEGATTVHLPETEARHRAGAR